MIEALESIGGFVHIVCIVGHVMVKPFQYQISQIDIFRATLAEKGYSGEKVKGVCFFVKCYYFDFLDKIFGCSFLEKDQLELNHRTLRNLMNKNF